MKITPDHLARGAFISTSGNPPSISLPTTMRADCVNMASPIVPALSGLDGCDSVIDDDLGRSGSWRQPSRASPRAAAGGDL